MNSNWWGLCKAQTQKGIPIKVRHILESFHCIIRFVFFSAGPYVRVGQKKKKKRAGPYLGPARTWWPAHTWQPARTLMDVPYLAAGLNKPVTHTSIHKRHHQFLGGRPEQPVANTIHTRHPSISYKAERKKKKRQKGTNKQTFQKR